MEVLHGNQPATGQGRRARDRAADGQRSLDWSTRPSDILLFPHSPLALADVLSHPAGRFDLLPVPPASSTAESELARENEHAREGDHDLPIVSLQQRRRRRRPRERVNLLTRHADAELLERCRRLLVENALVKGPGERQLFLAAGFLSWPAPGGGDARRRAPLLLYPVLLARLADEPRYELRLDGSLPLDNRMLAEAMHDRHGIALPASEAGTPLTDQLGRIASLLSGCDAVELEFDIALGNAEMPLHESGDAPPPVPMPPTAFDATLAAEITNARALDELHAVLHLLPDYGAANGETATGTEPESESESESGSTRAASDLSCLREYAALLAAEGLDDIEFSHLGRLPESLSSWRATVDAGLASDTVTTLVGDGSIGARHLVRLAGIIELVDKAPLVIERYAHPDLCFHATTGVLRRARHQARLIEDELAMLQDWFVLDKVPAKRQLLGLIEELGGSVGTEPDIVDADYFNARRRFMEFSIEKPANLTPEHRRLLGQLAKVLRFRELFVNNIEYRAALGPGYRGLRTDWEALESVSDYAIELADVLGSETLAAAAISAWPDFRRAFVTELETLQQAADATRRLLRIGGRRWSERPVGELLAYSAELGGRLAGWHAEYGAVESRADRTPATLLARFTGREREDLLTEARVGETQARIAARLAGGETTRARVVATLAWLREASDLARAHSLGIEPVLARLEPD